MQFERPRRKRVIIGSTQYRDKFDEVEKRLVAEGNFVRTPAFDDIDGDEIEIAEYNRDLIEWADEVHLIWDNRSGGTIFDMGMVFMARKPLVIEYIEPKTFENLFKKYAQKFISISIGYEDDGETPTKPN